MAKMLYLRPYSIFFHDKKANRVVLVSNNKRTKIRVCES